MRTSRETFEKKPSICIFVGNGRQFLTETILTLTVEKLAAFEPFLAK
jgi:hypothetical protein